eukprot:gene2167-2032_t
MGVVDSVFNSISSATYSEQQWKQLLDHIKNSTKTSQEITNFMDRLFLRLKKHEETHGFLKTNQIKVLFEYITKILTIEEVQLGKDWNKIILEQFSTLDTTIQNLIIEISLILIKIDENYRTKVFQNAISKPNQISLTYSIVEKISLKLPSLIFKIVEELIESPKITKQACDFCLHLIENSYFNSSFHFIAERNILFSLIKILKKIEDVEIEISCLWSISFIIPTYLQREKISNLVSFTNDLFSIFQKLFKNVHHDVVKPLKQFGKLLYTIFPHSFLEFVRKNELNVENLMKNYAFNPRLLLSPANELKLESMKNLNFKQIMNDSDLYQKRNKIDASYFSTELKNIEKLDADNTSLDVWWQKISDLQNYIEDYFEKEKTIYTNDLTKLQKKYLVLKNEKIFERFMRKKHENYSKELKKKLINSWELEDKLIDSSRRNDQQLEEIKILKNEMKKLKEINIRTKDTQINWEAKVQNNLDQTNFRIKGLLEKKLILDEKIDTLEHENYQLKEVLDSKVTEIYQLKTRLNFLNTKEVESLKMKKKLDSLQEEIFIFEQNQTLLLESIVKNQKLSSEILHRDKIIQALNKKLDNSLEKLRHINSIIYEKDLNISSYKLKVENQFNELQQEKQNIIYLTNVFEDKINSISRKYKTSKDINLYLEERILQMNSKIESLSKE